MRQQANPFSDPTFQRLFDSRFNTLSRPASRSPSSGSPLDYLLITLIVSVLFCLSVATCQFSW